MDNINETEILEDDILSEIILDEYREYKSAKENKEVILSRIERWEKIVHQKNDDIIKNNQIELEREKLEESKRQYDENQQREIERYTDEKEFKDADIQTRRDNLLIAQKKDNRDLIIDVAKILIPVGVTIGEGIFLFKMAQFGVAVEELGLLPNNPFSKTVTDCVKNSARKNF